MIDINRINKKLWRISINRNTLDADEIRQIQNILVVLYAGYNNNNYTLKESVIQEFMLWLEYYEFEYINHDQIIVQSELIENDIIFNEKEVVNPNLDKKLYNFQKEAIQFQVSKNRIYNAYDLGLAKTATTILTIATWYVKGLIDSAVLSVKNGLQYHWMHEILEFTHIFKESEISLIINDNKEKVFDNNTSKKIIIVPNHLLTDIFVSYKKKNKSKKIIASKMRWDKPCVNIKKIWDDNNIALVIDEAHEFKNSKAIKTRALQAHLHYFPHRIFISATPAVRAFEDWFTQLNMLDKGILGMPENAAKIYVSKKIGDEHSIYNIQEYDAVKVKQIKKKMMSIAHRKLKKDIPEMKTKLNVYPLYFSMEIEQRMLYNQIYHSELLKLDPKKEMSLYYVLSKFPYAVQVIENPCLLQDNIEIQNDFLEIINRWKIDYDPRIVWLDEYLNDLIVNNNKKVIIYDTHPKTLDQLKLRYIKYNPVIIHGQEHVDALQRQKLQDEFNFNKENKLALLSFGTSSTGINLQYGSSDIVVWSCPNDTQLLAQALSRTSRINSETDSKAIICVIDRSWDQIRYRRSMARIKLNDITFKDNLTPEELQILLAEAS